MDAVELLRDALKSLMQLCDHMSETMEEKATAYRKEHDLSVPEYHVEDPALDSDDEEDDEEEDEEDEQDEADNENNEGENAST